jgi:MerR family mercuric resistance operon transcriptional regulator
LTIGRLAAAAGVHVETVRYYQQRGLLPVPQAQGSVRHYPPGLVARIRFVKQAQELGFSLDEIGDLLQLQDGTDRRSIRRIAAERLAQIEAKLADLGRMKATLGHLLTTCEQGEHAPRCPIIEAFSGPIHGHGSGG